MLILIGVALIVVLTAATGYFVAQEFAYVAVDRSKLKRAADAGDAPSARALRVTERLSFMLSGAQLGITVTALLVGFVAEPYLGQGLAQLLGAAGIPRAVSVSIALGSALLLATVVQMVLGELGPKNWAIAEPERLARALSRSTVLYLTVAGPLIRLFDTAANRLLRRAGIEPIEELPEGATAEDLQRIIADSHTGGLLDDDTSHLLERGLGFRARIAEEAMVPRVDVVTVAAADPALRLVSLLDTGHTRFPVLGDGVDDLRGVVSAADVVALPADARRHTTMAQIAAAPVLVPAAAALPAVLERLRAEHRQLACVVDEFGGFAGIISLEDIAEELVGAIRDEDDPPEPAPMRQSDGSWLVPARWRVDEIAQATGVRLPAGEAYDTVSGLVLQLLGRVPQPGDVVEVAVPADPDGDAPRRVRLQVLTVQRHVPATLRMVLLGDDATARGRVHP
ncbi:CBS domain containing-hemolysin-like protein [Krasilnikovia cinnamomea]|uniref:CBS domain containing-hemolysin-like protein n=1 Tax=Krasilnikovia cinnamomea TaxID=349313 RepID=A0A4Q7ZUM8_9ACTN|nr:hemolysin family protein [Krasilnikovia cinnamomea]RZU54289.1 CBS domain containing-hemolysin-like protein [Krasilnikovia cinnamomea]